MEMALRARERVPPPYPNLPPAPPGGGPVNDKEGNRWFPSLDLLSFKPPPSQPSPGPAGGGPVNDKEGNPWFPSLHLLSF